jgi:MFS transporter, putative metabolite:H+ symporter
MSDESDTATVDNLVARLNRIPLTRTGVKVLILLQIAWIIEGIDIGVSGPVLLLLKDIWHLNPQELGILGASGTLGIVLGLIPAGYLADRFGRKPLAVWGMLQFTFFTGLEALAPNYSWFLVLRFLDGIGQGVLFAVPYLMISEFLRPARRATVVGFENGILEMAYVIPALLGAWAVSHFAPESAWRLILLISTSTIIYVPVLARWLPESPRWLLKHGKIEQARKLIERLEREANLGADLSLSTGAAAIIADDKTPSVREYFTRPFLGRSFVTYTAYTAGLMMWYGMLTYGPIIFRGVGFTSTNAILMLGFMMFVGSLGNFLNGFLADKLGRKPVLGIYAYAGAMAAVVLAFSDGPASIVLAGAAAAFFGLGGFPTQKIYIAEQYPTRLRGFGTSVGEGVSRFLGGVLAAYYIPAILALGGTQAVFLFISGATALLVLPALLFGRETAGIDIDIAGHASATRISTVAGNRGEAWSNRLFGRLHGASTSPSAAPLIDSK